MKVFQTQQTTITALIIITVSIQYVNNAVLSDAEQKKYKKFIEGQGLYAPDDDVTILTAANFKSTVLGSPRAHLVEFYNSWCGFCQRFAPSWRALATDLKPWADLVQIAALDCSDDANTAICREYEIMGYPTLRYFHERYEAGIGDNVPKGDDLPSHRLFLLHKLIDEQSRGRGAQFPPLAPYAGPRIGDFFASAAAAVRFGFMVVEAPPMALLGALLALDFHKTEQVLIRSASNNNTDLLHDLKIARFPTIVIMDGQRPGSYEAHSSFENRDELRLLITNYLLNKGVRVADDLGEKKGDVFTGKWLEAEVPDMAALIQARAKQVLKERLKKMGDVVFQMDLETALRHSLKAEVGSVKLIQGEQLAALRGYTEALKTYFPFGVSGKLFLHELDRLVQTSGAVEGAEVARLVDEAQAGGLVFSSAPGWMACEGSRPNFRGYPCGLWKLFHYLTVNSAEAQVYARRSDPLEVLDVMHGYVKEFFGCAECSRHFQEMAAQRAMHNVSSLDEAILWLWRAHNQVNQRLSGDASEDPEYPKVVFPSRRNCPTCARDADWNLVEVLRYLKQVYSSVNVRYIGSDTRVLHLALQDAMGMGRNGVFGGSGGGDSIFNTFDSSMCFLLYVVSFFLLALIIRMFLKRGYRKKPYIHDLLGKV